MRNLFTFVIVCVVAMFPTAVYAGNPEVSFKGTELSINGVSYSIKGYKYQDGAYSAVKNADFVYVVPMPEGYAGDWCDFIQFENGDVAIEYARSYYVFTDKGISECRKLEENNFIYLFDGYSFYGDNPFEVGNKVGYFYADKNDKTHIVIFGKK